jgi:hypothetical protein
VGPGRNRAQWSAAGCAREKPGGDGPPISGPGRHSAGWRGVKPDLKQNPNSNASNKFQIASNFARLEKYFPGLRKIEMKYGQKSLEIRINFPYRNFYRFEMEFEFKFREFSVVRI